MTKSIQVMLAAELEFCEKEMKHYTDIGYPTKTTKGNAVAYWRGRKDAVQEIRSKVEGR